jgi:N-methylhydantoinase A/oxoprolinase/acetone carboxylase beta subunit
MKGADPSAARKPARRVLWAAAEGFRDTPVFDLDRLEPGNRVNGPAIVEAKDTVCPVPPGATFTVDQYRAGVLTLDAPRDDGPAHKGNP